MKKQNVKIDLCAYTNRNEKLETTVNVPFSSDEKKMKEAAIKLGEKFWYSYDKALISHICVDYIHN